MDFIIPTSKLSILIACILAVFITFHIVVDIKEIIHSKKLHRNLMVIATKHSAKTISVVIQLSKSPDTIIPLINHLYGHKYPGLEVIIINNSTSKNSNKLLIKYRRDNKIKQLKIINYKKDWKIRDYLRRYGTGKLAMIKHYLKLEDGFNKKNKIYGDIAFIYDESKKQRGYTFKYKGEGSIYSWDNNGEGKKQDLSWLNQCVGKNSVKQSAWNTPLHYESFQDMIHDIWSFLAHDGYKYVSKVPNYTEKRRFII